MAKDSRASRPRALAPGAQTQAEIRPAVYKSPLHLERQKFLKAKTVSQLYFKETGEWPEPATIQTYGLTLNFGQLSALAAIQILLDDQDSQVRETQGDTPTLWITPAQYYEAYGLKRIETDGKQRYSGRQMTEAMADLSSLTQSRRVIYEMRYWHGKGKQRRESSRIIVSEGSLIVLDTSYDRPSTKEADAIKAGRGKSPAPSSVMKITCSSTLTAQIDRLYVLKERDLIPRIKAFYAGKRPHAGALLLIDYLLTLDFSPLEERAEELAIKAGLGYLIKQRKKRQALTELQEYIRIAEEEGYLLKWELNSLGNYILELNPAKCSRYVAKQKRQAKLAALASGGENKS